MNCRFVVIGNSVAYTTANEIGAFLMSKGVKFKAFSNDSNSYHFGTVFNERLITGIKKAVGCGGNVSYTINDFPKLIYNKIFQVLFYSSKLEQDKLGLLQYQHNEPIFRYLQFEYL